MKFDITTLNENKKTFDSFKKDFNDVITHADAYLRGDVIKIYLDTNPNKEKNTINKLVRTKYSDKLKKVRSEDDVMKFDITTLSEQELFNYLEKK
jgi:serine protease inhibitor